MDLDNLMLGILSLSSVCMDFRQVMFILFNPIELQCNWCNLIVFTKTRDTIWIYFLLKVNFFYWILWLNAYFLRLT
jgi:hypothetical protein